MWLICALLTFFSWGIADLFYKKGNKSDDQYSHIKTGIMVGLVMGIHCFIYMIINKMNIDLINIIKYLPVSLCYIGSMIIGYKGLKYLELSISSPIQNSSGIITSLLLCIIFKIRLTNLETLGICVVFVGVLTLSLLEIYYDKNNRHQLIKNFSIYAFFFPIIYCFIDGVGTFLDSVYLDQLKIVTEDVALISYEFTFFMYAVILYIYLLLKKHVEVNIFKENNKLLAAIFETLGQFLYVFAISSHSVITVPIIACYSSLSVLLSRIFLKEKLVITQYIALLIIFIGIFILAIVESIT